MSFFTKSPLEILVIVQENEYLGIFWRIFFFYLFMKLYVVCSNKNGLIKAILMSTLIINIIL